MCTIIFFATNKATSRGYRTRNFRPATHSRVESSQSQGIKGLTIGCRGRQSRPLALKVATYKPNSRDLPRRSSRPPTSEDATHTIRRRDLRHPKTRPTPSEDATRTATGRDPSQHKTRINKRVIASKKPTDASDQSGNTCLQHQKHNPTTVQTTSTKKTDYDLQHNKLKHITTLLKLHHDVVGTTS